MLDAIKLKDDLIKSAEEITENWDTLLNKLSIVDKKRSDIEHYIEFNNLNASQGYKAYKLLQEVLMEKREIKNKLEEIKPLFHLVNNTNLKSAINNASKKVQRVISSNKTAKENKRYQVRVLQEIFGEEMKNNNT